MTSMSTERLDEIRERAEAATEGPWRSHDFGHAGEEEPSSIVVHVGRFDHSDLLTYDTETAVAWMPRWERQESDNATFIARARADVPDLIAEVDRLRAGIEAVRTNALMSREGLPRDVFDRPVGEGSLALRETARLCYALLNPPTEGETDGEV